MTKYCLPPGTVWVLPKIQSYLQVVAKSSSNYGALLSTKPPLSMELPQRDASQHNGKNGRPSSFKAFLHQRTDGSRRERIDMSEADDILKAVDALTLNMPSTSRPLTHAYVRTYNNADRHVYQGTRWGELHLQDTLCSFAQCAGAACAAMVAEKFIGRFIRNVCQFYSQMFIATCDVALHKGHPEKLVNAAQLVFLRSSRENLSYIISNITVKCLKESEIARRSFRLGFSGSSVTSPLSIFDATRI
ncbi:uncharacterized protein F5Z01DRAFT_467526 [Emericellopsis atlantica]|uniref:Uncharacterized protein n=1 Tax=Emericellopsis atlantica TaxID=2614577 RepID=A0A9P7ZE01_9HYPO|nr:uncharacterized protein F5Z01DRAFT_467526 [Emericellopsis atlantica]KAG9249723.1 hypothetical protein F5Z01DRAFT_467526 [Emericellopsis atlantica]